MGRYAVLSDIHGNDYALASVLENMEACGVRGVILLGDLIDYGMQPNEVVRRIRDSRSGDIVCSIWGNHEYAVMMEDYGGFSSERGVLSARKTHSLLQPDVRSYLNSQMLHAGQKEFVIDGLKCLAVHGSMEDCYWKPVLPDDVHGDYSGYDIVFSGHSHCPHMFTKFYDCHDEKMRNKHAVVFVNPGSVGQPRNHHPQAQYAVFDTQTRSVEMKSVPYDAEKAMSCFDGSMDDFYRMRLKLGV